MHPKDREDLFSKTNFYVLMCSGENFISLTMTAETAQGGNALLLGHLWDPNDLANL